jgi:hypothetical protein
MSQPYRPLLPLHSPTVRLAVDSGFPWPTPVETTVVSIADARISSNATRVEQSDGWIAAEGLVELGRWSEVDGLVAELWEAGEELRRANEARKKLSQYLDALEAGMDPALVTERTRVAQGELASSNAVINACDSSGTGELSEQQLHELLEGVGGLTALLANSNSAERQQVYRAASVHLRHQRSEEGERITASLRVGLFRVGGPDSAKPDWRIQPWGHER